MFFLTTEHLPYHEKMYDLRASNWWAVKYWEMEKEDGLNLGFKKANCTLASVAFRSQHHFSFASQLWLTAHDSPPPVSCYKSFQGKYAFWCVELQMKITEERITLQKENQNPSTPAFELSGQPEIMKGRTAGALVLKLSVVTPLEKLGSGLKDRCPVRRNLFHT